MPIRSAALACFLTLITASLAAAFEGRVVDSQGKPIAGAEVTILGRTGEAFTDSDGRFTWTPDPLSGAGPRTHYWAAEWQAVGWLDDPEGAYPLAPRRGAPVGLYRFRVVGPGYEGAAVGGSDQS